MPLFGRASFVRVVSLLPATCSALGPSVEVDDLQGVTVLGINPSVLSRSSRMAKRTLDLAGAGLLSVLVADAEVRRAELLAQSKDPGWLHLEHDPRVTRVGRLLRRDGRIRRSQAAAASRSSR